MQGILMHCLYGLLKLSQGHQISPLRKPTMEIRETGTGWVIWCSNRALMRSTLQYRNAAPMPFPAHDQCCFARTYHAQLSTNFDVSFACRIFHRRGDQFRKQVSFRLVLFSAGARAGRGTSCGYADRKVANFLDHAKTSRLYICFAVFRHEC
jgi:hypothetical protein